MKAIHEDIRIFRTFAWNSRRRHSRALFQVFSWRKSSKQIPSASSKPSGSEQFVMTLFFTLPQATRNWTRAPHHRPRNESRFAEAKRGGSGEIPPRAAGVKTCFIGSGDEVGEPRAGTEVFTEGHHRDGEANGRGQPRSSRLSNHNTSAGNGAFQTKRGSQTDGERAGRTSGTPWTTMPFLGGREMCVYHSPFSMLMAKSECKKNSYVMCVYFFLGKTQEEGLRRVQELKIELSSLREFKRDEKRRQIQLQQEHAVLTEELAKEKVTQNILSHDARF